jgi:hypothetical protein
MAGEIALSLMADAERPKIEARIVAVVEASFIEDKSRVTRSEVRRRTTLCLEAFADLRRSLKWSTPRCLDELARVLRFKLDGVPWKPDTRRAMWVAPDPVIPGRFA